MPCVHPVAILRAVFCTICSLSMFVSDALGDHMVEAYSSTGLVMALYVASMVSLCLPHFVEVRTLSMLMFCVLWLLPGLCVCCR